MPLSLQERDLTYRIYLVFSFLRTYMSAAAFWNLSTGQMSLFLRRPLLRFGGIASSISSNLASDACLVSASKGIEQYSLQTITQVLHHCCGTDRLVVLSGPSFAVEVARELPTAVVAASALPQLASGVQGLFSGSRFRVYTSYDVAGVEFGGAMKNVIAIAAGVCHGMQLGQNAIAALVTRGLAEMSRLAVVLGAQAQTLAGLAGLGDLMLTCNGDLSRNRQVGIQLASGKTVEAITAGMKTVAEGLLTTNSIVALGRRENVSLPIAEQMHSTLHGGCSPQDAIRFLMERSLKEE